MSFPKDKETEEVLHDHRLGHHHDHHPLRTAVHRACKPQALFGYRMAVARLPAALSRGAFLPPPWQPQAVQASAYWAAYDGRSHKPCLGRGQEAARAGLFVRSTDRATLRAVRQTQYQPGRPARLRWECRRTPPAQSGGHVDVLRPASGCEHPPDRGRLPRSEEHTSELQSQSNLVCRLLLEKKKSEASRRDAEN